MRGVWMKRELIGDVRRHRTKLRNMTRREQSAYEVSH